MSKIASTLATLQAPKPTDGAILAGAEKLMAEMSPEEREAFQKSEASAASEAEHSTEQPVTEQPAQFDAEVERRIAAEVERRVASQAKTHAQVTDYSPAAAAVKLGTAEQPAAVQRRFMSRFPQLQIYVPAFGRKDFAVKFKNGIFATSEPELADALAAHAGCNTALFREESDVRRVAVRAAADRQRAALLSPSHVGAVASSDGNEANFARQTAELESLEHKMLNGGAF